MCIECFDALPRFRYKSKEYIAWQDDSICRVGFSAVPDIGNKEINNKVMSKAEIKAAKKKPLYLKNTVEVCLIDKVKNKTYTFMINAGYDYDGASIARIFWRLIGSKEILNLKLLH